MFLHDRKPYRFVYLSLLTAACSFILSGKSLCLPQVPMSPPPLSPFRQAAFPIWDAGKQGQFIMSLAQDLHGNIWAGTEGQGIWRHSPKAAVGKQWTQFTVKDGLGDDTAYALVCDKAGRIWAGTDSHGVSVFNGQSWKSYDQVTGPLGVHVTALGVSPIDGGVWGATEAGLFRYKGGHWSYFTRADGLPADQISGLAFGADGTLYVGTQCNGIAIASAADGYQSWRTVSGPERMPNQATGKGLPSAQITCLFTTASGAVFVGTPMGLAGSNDKGVTWQFRRGVDWKDKLAGLAHPITPETRPVDGNLLSEDYVTCLGEDASGRVMIGHRQGGVEAFDPKTGVRTQSGENGSTPDAYISSLLSVGGSVWLGLYGGGLLPPSVPEDEISAGADVPVSNYPAFPLPAAPPSVTQLAAMRAKVLALRTPLPIGGAAYLGEDWATQGDWVGRYGSRYAVLCAAGAPLDQYVLSDLSYRVIGFSGPHHQEGDSMRSWCHWVRTDDPRVLWDPIAGYRREAEWDDHGEDYSPSFDGPDVWAEVTVPAGLHRLSLYLMNKDGHDGSNRDRDYLVGLKAGPSSMDAGTAAGNIGAAANVSSAGNAADPEALPTIAQARVRNFWFGVYERFLVRGPGVYLVKVSKNGSINTILQTVMLDKVSGPPTPYEKRRSVWYGKDTYRPPLASLPLKPSSTLTAAQNLWDALDRSQDQEGAEVPLPRFRVLAYRAAVADPASASAPTLLANWRWQLSLWDAPERQAFLAGMNSSRQSLLESNPKLALGNQ